uniref:Putative di-and tripeptidase DUG2 n=1 Tax=Talaromyces marneffei PM1 TaxID=1077442 RepID=A0A093VIM6_TALMA
MPRFSLDSDDHSENESPGSFSSNDHHLREFSSKLSMQNDCAIGHRVQASRSVLAVALDEECVFAGLQGGDILAWSLATYELVLSIPAHGESVLSLFISPDGQLLFSSGSDSVVNVWSTSTFERLYTIYSHHDVGDIFTVVYSQQLNTVFCGGQNTSLQWCNLSTDGEGAVARHPSQRTHRFFDSRGPGGSINPQSDDSDDPSLTDNSGKTLTFNRDQHRLFSHHGYIYCMIIVQGLIESAPSEEVLLTGSGDGSVKLWRLTHENNGAPIPWFEVENGDDAVLSLAIEGSLLYCGLAGGALNIWNLDSQQLVKQITEHQGDLWALDIMDGIAIAGDAEGVVKKFDSNFEEIGCWTAHQGTILASTTRVSNNRRIYATGGNDNSVAIWDIAGPPEQKEIQHFGNVPSSRLNVTKEPRSCAGTTVADTNPVVYARFSASNPGPDVKTILFYGHYDVVGADNNQHKWRTDPFQLASVDGYLYGRGVSDNKGPILAAVYAAADLVRRKALGCDIVFMIEGEEESGSQGFERAVRENKDLIGKVDWILLANSYWLDDHIPCLTYGLRGVVHANLIITSDHPDLHSGIDGSSLLDEPLKDLSLLLATFIGRKGHINFPNFYDTVADMTKAEEQRFQAITDAMLPLHPQIEDREAFPHFLRYRWREPSFTVHSIEVPSNKNTGTTISRRAKATLSVRIVPNQSADEIASALTAFAQEQFDLLDSQNELTIEITGKADPWLGDPDNEIFGTLAEAISAAWTPNLNEKRYNYPQPQSKATMRSFGAELNRTDSNDSVASHIDRIISSSTTSSKKKAQRKQSASNATVVPTSSTLTGIRTNGKQGDDVADHPEDSLSPSSSLVSLPTHGHGNGDGISRHDTATSPPPTSAWPTHIEPPTPVKPIYIREGGSIPTIRFLEREFSAPAANLPCGQASDHAHLDNERLRVMNLYKSREIFGWVFEKLPQRGNK